MAKGVVIDHDILRWGKEKSAELSKTYENIVPVGSDSDSRRRSRCDYRLDPSVRILHQLPCLLTRDGDVISIATAFRQSALYFLPGEGNVVHFQEQFDALHEVLHSRSADFLPFDALLLELEETHDAIHQPLALLAFLHKQPTSFPVVPDIPRKSKNLPSLYVYLSLVTGDLNENTNSE